MQVDMWFPTPVAQHTVSDNLISATKESVILWNTSETKSAYLEYYYAENLITSYHKHHDILEVINLIDLRNEIINTSLEFSSGFGSILTRENIKVDSWINFFEPGQYEAEHNHFGNYLSGVYYVDAYPECGNYELYDPAKQRVLWSSVYVNNSQSSFINKKSHAYVPKSGMLLLFPSYIDHAVQRNTTQHTRISIAFNINPSIH